MKKLFLTLLLLPIAINSSEKQQEMQQRLEKELESTKTMLKDPEYLTFVLGNKLDLHFHGTITPGFAAEEAQRIHNNLVSEIGESKKGFLKPITIQAKNHFEAGKSLPSSPDAIIVNTCATIEQNLRKNGNAGIISGKNPLMRNDPLVRFVRFFTGSTCNFDGKRFYDNACPCLFYKNLTDEQLEQLRKGTQEASK
jgi:hypothetical protein